MNFFRKLLSIFFYIFLMLVLFFNFEDLFQKPEVDAKAFKLSLKEVSQEVNVDFVHENRLQFRKEIDNLLQGLKPFYEAFSASVSVVDINQDGWSDFFVPSTKRGSRSHLYINTGHGRFVEKARDYALDLLPEPVRAGFFDCDNDGEPEMLLTTNHCPILYKKDSLGQYKKIYKFPEPCQMSTAFNIFDYNRDGYLDLSVAAFSHIVPNNWHNSNNGPGGVVFYKNEGQCRFSRDTKDLNERNRRFTHAIGVVDSRNKERQDLWAATDFNLDRIFFQKDDDSYEQADEILYNSKAHNGMSVEPYYLSGDSYPSVFISQVYQPRYAVTGNQLWTFDGHKFVDSAKEQGVNKCGWAWGALFEDLNNDGRPDLIVSNGFISGDPQNQYWSMMNRFAPSSRRYLSNSINWRPVNNTTWSGHERDCVFMNTPKGFVNVSEAIDFDKDKLDGRGLVSIDLLNNGKLSVIVANQKQKLNFYKNETPSEGHWIGFRLIGKTSNRDGIGTKIKLKLENGNTLVRAHYPFNGYSAQKSSKIHFGLGPYKVAEVIVHWTNGLQEKYLNPKLDAYHSLEEGQGVAL